MADETEDTPRARIAAAIAGKPAKAAPEVLAADVVAVAGTVPAAKRTKVITDLAAGAARALAETNTPDTLAVHQYARQLAGLLEAATGDGTENPVPEGA